MSERMFDSGLIVGRFQHIHSGHEKLINIGLNLCDKVLVFIGSCDEELTIRNPFSFEYRKELIYKIFSNEIDDGRLILYPLKDLTNENDLSPKWGEYVFNEANKVLGNIPSVMIYGKDKNIFKCFSKSVVENVSEILIDRKYLNISATKMREYIRENDRKSWEKYANPLIYDEYDKIKSIIDKLEYN